MQWLGVKWPLTLCGNAVPPMPAGGVLRRRRSRARALPRRRLGMLVRRRKEVETLFLGWGNANRRGRVHHAAHQVRQTVEQQASLRNKVPTVGPDIYGNRP